MHAHVCVLVPVLAHTCASTCMCVRVCGKMERQLTSLLVIWGDREKEEKYPSLREKKVLRVPLMNMQRPSERSPLLERNGVPSRKGSGKAFPEDIELHLKCVSVLARICAQTCKVHRCVSAYLCTCVQGTRVDLSLCAYMYTCMHSARVCLCAHLYL